MRAASDILSTACPSPTINSRHAEIECVSINLRCNEPREMMIAPASKPNMAREAATTASKLAARRLAPHCAAFKGADSKRTILQLVVTAAPFLRRFGGFNHRRFRLNLCGTAYEPHTRNLECYRMILRLPETCAPSALARTGGRSKHLHTRTNVDSST